MLIDWFTVVAQGLNFVVLLWLLKHFLYQPILNAIDSREKGIAGQLAEANARKADAEKEQLEFHDKNKAFDDQRSALLLKATNDAKAEHDQLVGQAHKEADQLRTDQATALQNDQVRLSKNITRTVKEEVFAISRKTLTDLASASLEERMGAAFTRRLSQMDPKAKETMTAAIKISSGPVLVRSAFDLPAPVRATIQNAINETFSADVHLRFETGDTICGIELTASGQKIGWSIADYLTALDEKVGAAIDAEPGQPSKAKPPSEIESDAEAAKAPVAEHAMAVGAK